MSPELLVKLITDGQLSLEPTVKSQMLKLRKQKLRKDSKKKKMPDLVKTVQKQSDTAPCNDGRVERRY